MLRRILLYLFALALLNASPGFHWHDHPNEPRLAVSAGERVAADLAQGEGEEQESERGPCADCMLQAQQTAHPSGGSAWPVLAQPARAGLQQRHATAHFQSPRADAIRVRGPPSIGT